MAFAKGTLVLAEYDGKAKGSDDVVDTTRKARAGSEPAPQLIAVGEGWVLAALDEAIASMSAGEERTIEVPPERAYGARDPGKVRMIPLRKLGEDAEKVGVGDTIEIDGRKGAIRYIGSGRVQVDYNHQHAGKTIVYSVRVVRALEADADKTTAIIEKGMKDVGRGTTSTLSGETLEVMIPRAAFRASGLQPAKHMIQHDVFRFVPAVKRLRFVEEHLAAPPPATATRSEFLKPAPPGQIRSRV